MARLRVLTPLRVESLAVRGETEVVGMGRARARRAGASLAGRLPTDTALALVGVAGGLSPQLRTGDLVVPTSLASETGDDRVALPSATLLANELRRTGVRTHTGPIVSSARFVRGTGRAALAAGGAVAVDMESAFLAAPLAGHPLAVVRAVSDTSDRTVVRGGLDALRSLRAVRGPLQRWAAACRPRDLLLAAPRSFCAGVDRAIEIVERALERYGAPVYVRRQIVHNLHVVTSLESKGAVFVEELDEVPDGAVVVFAAHGVSPAVRDEAAAREGLTVVDATCPLVAKVHAEARRFAAKGMDVVLVGHRDHEEVEGTVGEAPDRIHVVADVDEVEALTLGRGAGVAVLTQTTLAVDEAREVIDALRGRFGDVAEPPGDDICYATQNRQDAVRAIARRCDLLVVVGSQNSSNTARLVELGHREGVRTELVEDASELDLGWLAPAGVVGLTAGASVPEALVDEVLATLGHLGPLSVTEERVADESVRFSLPAKVR